MNYFSHNPLNRFAELRPDTERMEQLWQQAEVRVLVVNDQMSLLWQKGPEKQAAMLRRAEAEKLESLAQVRVFLGIEAGVPYFALGFEGMQEQLFATLGAGYTFANLRTIALELPQHHSSLLASAGGMVYWNLR